MPRETIDTQRSLIINEQISKEDKALDKFYTALEAANPPSPKEEQKAPTPPPTITLPELDPEKAMAFELSRSLWRSCNPGYSIVAGPGNSVSTMKDDFAINQEELEFMKSQGAYDKKNNRTRDKFTVYVEARARYGLLMKKQQSTIAFVGLDVCL